MTSDPLNQSDSPLIGGRRLALASSTVPDVDFLMKSISGIRGRVGEGLTPTAVLRYVTGFADMQLHRHHAAPGQPTLVLGRDSRVSGVWLEPFVAGLLQSMGVRVLSLGIVPTPTVQLLVQLEQASLGGVIITSSHNPIEWNGLKFVDADGLFLEPRACAKLYASVDADPCWPPSAVFCDALSIGPLRHLADAASRHVQALLALPFVDAQRIRERRFRVALDAVNGAGGPIMGELLHALGCAVVGLNLEPTGVFAHPPEPVGENLGQLCAAVRGEQGRVDLGVAVDPDVDRCVLVDEAGRPIGEEYTLALSVAFLLRHCGRRGPIVKNLSTTRAIDAIAAQFEGCLVHATPVGEIYVARRMVEVGAVVGGEGNGGVMLPEVHVGRDAPVALVLTLQHLAQVGGTLSALKATLPQYEIAKLKAELSPSVSPEGILAAIQREWQDKAVIDTQDGLHISTPDWWVHLRKSNTEPIIRVIGEGGSLDVSTARCQEFLTIIQQKLNL